MTTTESAPTSRPSGLDLNWVDPDVRPQDDLFAHVNGRWLATHEIPDDRSQDGAFRVLRDRAEDQVHEIVEECASSAEPGTEARKVGDLYRSFMDVERAEELGTAPLRPLLDEIYAATDRAALAGVLGRRQREGRAALFGEFIATDLKDSSRYLVNLNQAGLGLPDESYYGDEGDPEIRTKYVEHLQRLAELVGLAEPERVAEQVMDLETALADASWDRVLNRDAEKTYTLMTRDELRAAAPGFDWAEWESALGVPAHAYDEVIVRQPSFVTAAGELWAGRPAKKLRDLNDAAVAGMQLGVAHYAENAKHHAQAVAESE